MVLIYSWCVFLFGPMGKRNLIHFLKNLIDVTLIWNLHLSQVTLLFHFLILKWAYLTGTSPLICTSDLQIGTSFYTSSHPDHTKSFIIYSQAQKISRICCKNSDFLKHLESMKSSFEVRDYPEKLIEQEMEKVKCFKNGWVVRQRDPRKGVPFVLTYHPLFELISKITKIFICCIWITRSKKCLPLNQWFLSIVQEK